MESIKPSSRPSIVNQSESPWPAIVRELTEKLKANPFMPLYLAREIRRERAQAIRAYERNYGEAAADELMQSVGL